jgi:hypothetical protein
VFVALVRSEALVSFIDSLRPMFLPRPGNPNV